MPITALDPKTALIVVDLQKGVSDLIPNDKLKPLLDRIVALLTAFRRKGLPVVLVNVSGLAPGRTEQPKPKGNPPPGWDILLPELGQQPTDILITKQAWGAFINTGLKERLQMIGVTQVVITGVATSVGVESTARQAYEMGFNVTLPLDAMTDLDPQASQTSLRTIFPRLGETGSTQEVLDLLNR